MNYLQRLACRMSGLARENSLRPDIRRWQDIVDPFENWSIAQPAIPLTSERPDATSQISLPTDQRSPAGRNHRGIIEIERPAETPEARLEPRRDWRRVTPEDRPARPKKGKSTFGKQPAKSPSRAVKKTARSDATVVDDNGFADKKSKSSDPVRDRSTAERAADDSGTRAKTGRSKLLARLQRKVSTSMHSTDDPALNGRAEPQSGSAAAVRVSAESGLAPVRPTRPRVPPASAVRRRKSVSSRAEAPKLVIGKLKVDVVAVDDRPKTRHANAPVVKRSKSNRTRVADRQTVKMKFGLGQM